MKLLSQKHNVEEVDENLFRIVLPQPFYTPNNLYLIKDGQNILIDSGYIESIGELAASLKYLGLSFSKINWLIYTHPHIDHITGGLLISQYSRNLQRAAHYSLPADIPNYLSFIEQYREDEARLLQTGFSNAEVRSRRISQSRRRWGRFLRRFKNPETAKTGQRNIRLEKLLREGDNISTEQHRLDILETPGHCKWHITPLEKTRKWIFTGDLIIGNLPAIYDHLDGNLAEFENTMNRLLDYEDYRVFPAHGEEITALKHRVKVQLKTLSILEKGILRRLREDRHDLVQLTEGAIGAQVQSSGMFMVALALVESIVRKLVRTGEVTSVVDENDYELFSTS